MNELVITEFPECNGNKLICISHNDNLYNVIYEIELKNLTVYKVGFEQHQLFIDKFETYDNVIKNLSCSTENLIRDIEAIIKFS